MKLPRMSRSDLDDLLERYSKGETSPEENQKVEEWLSRHQNQDNYWDVMSDSGRKVWLDKLWTDINVSVNRPARVISMPAKRSWWPAVASIAAILAISLGLWFTREGRDTTAPAEFLALKTLASEKKSVVLSDGSTIWLNAGSELKYPAIFSGKGREVYLDGEAYFDIKHDDKKAFIVHTGKILTIVVGTAFNIVTAEKDSLVMVTVTRGKVSVSEGKTLLGFINPNQQITYNKQQRNFVKSNVDATSVISWKSEDLLFDDITFAEAADILSKRFNVRIGFTNDAIKDCRFSGTAISGKNLDEILKVICAFNNANFRHNPDRSVSIDGRGCK